MSSRRHWIHSTYIDTHEHKQPANLFLTVPVSGQGEATASFGTYDAASGAFVDLGYGGRDVSFVLCRCVVEERVARCLRALVFAQIQSMICLTHNRTRSRRAPTCELITH